MSPVQGRLICSLNTAGTRPSIRKVVVAGGGRWRERERPSEIGEGSLCCVAAPSVCGPIPPPSLRPSLESPQQRLRKKAPRCRFLKRTPRADRARLPPCRQSPERFKGVDHRDDPFSPSAFLPPFLPSAASDSTSAWASAWAGCAARLRTARACAERVPQRVLRLAPLSPPPERPWLTRPRRGEPRGVLACAGPHGATGPRPHSPRSGEERHSAAFRTRAGQGRRKERRRRRLLPRPSTSLFRVSRSEGGRKEGRKERRGEEREMFRVSRSEEGRERETKRERERERESILRETTSIPLRKEVEEVGEGCRRTGGRRWTLDFID